MDALPHTDLPPTRKALVLTALPVEFEAVCAHLSARREEHHERGNVYERGSFESVHGAWDVLVVQTGATNQQAALETERAIQHFRPDVALFVGVAGGLKDVAIGDVVAATKVYGYESGKAGTSFESRPELGRSSYALERRANAEARSDRWLSRINRRPTGRLPRAFVGPIAAGEKVVADTRSALRQFLQSHYGDALAVEMEGFGFLNAVHANQTVEALVVRGISDCIDGKSAADASGSQELAARHASAFAFEILSKFAASKEASSSGAHPIPNPGMPTGEVPRTGSEDARTVPVQQAPPTSGSSPRSNPLRTVVLVLLMGVLVSMALGLFRSRSSRGHWPREPSSGSRGDWRRAPSR